jgi:hypothetical protein
MDDEDFLILLGSDDEEDGENDEIGKTSVLRKDNYHARRQRKDNLFRNFWQNKKKSRAKN